jgi:23S rRNA (cytidine2498-2'-O)-methyltransferase
MESEGALGRLGSGNPTLVLCKPAYLAALRGEIGASAPNLKIATTGQGWILLEGESPPRRPWVFERQRLPGASRLSGQSRRELAACAWAALAGKIGNTPWTLHVFCPDPSAADSLQKRAAGIGAAFRERLGAESLASAHYRQAEQVGPDDRDTRVVQLCLTEGELWVSLAPLEALSSPWPGGVHRIADPSAHVRGRAPSRSYMKIEEALALFGESPRPGQRVVDLGAAPGGWSYAFLRRGCRVTAVDRGALKLGSSGEWGGTLEHLSEDGLRYRPPAPVDWLLSDMLIPPGVTLGLLRKWIGQGWARRFIVNVKLPQREPYAALRPLLEFLESVPVARLGLRQLHHDRREVTAWGRIEARSAREAR